MCVIDVNFQQISVLLVYYQVSSLLFIYISQECVWQGMPTMCLRGFLMSFINVWHPENLRVFLKVSSWSHSTWWLTIKKMNLFPMSVSYNIYTVFSCHNNWGTQNINNGKYHFLRNDLPFIKYIFVCQNNALEML